MADRSTPRFVRSFRDAAPYVHAFRGRTFVVVFGGEMVAEGQFTALAHDLALLNSLGVRLVLVHGARPQIEERIAAHGGELRYEQGWRVTDAAALGAVKEGVGRLRLEIEAALSMGLAHTPMAGAALRVVSGNFLRARPVGVRGGVDFEYTGEVRSVDVEGIGRCLDADEMVLLSPVGASPTGELFNLRAEEVASSAAAALGADKLLFLVDTPGLEDIDGRLQGHLAPEEVSRVLEARADLPEEIALHLQTALHACTAGVRRVHLVSRHRDGAVLQELFTRDGVGTLITGERYEDTRPAHEDDIGGILELIEPLEAEGVLVRRGRERLETEIGDFLVMERDGAVVATAALHPFPEQGVAELACLAVHPDYRGGGRGEVLLGQVEERARGQGLHGLFVLTTRAAHWFLERGFAETGLDALPVERRALYNLDRRSKVFWKAIA
ncbi:amino-acid N-acetyltransferase [Thiohalorhabdus methylotrophus]|uniref:Amino-acid acetyltransferase n=1 Tax=Thiohalorhabdus methylotrophus TaxID=3242694 RepID=A0ABV4TQJ2_9GAMM